MNPTGLFDVAMGQAAPVAPDLEKVAAAGAAIDDFGFDLLRRLDPSGNSCSSPTSIALALAMVRSGARGNTAAQMDQVLHSFGAPGQAAQIAALLQLLNSQTIYVDENGMPQPSLAASGQEPVVRLTVTDQVFAQKGMPLLPDYLNSLGSGFGAGIGLLDYKADPEAARKVINEWVSRQTDGRIPQILQQGDVTALTRIALANAIYLKSAWTHPFDPSLTASRPFTTASGATVSVPTMSAELWLNYAAGSGYRAVELPYGPDTSTLSMLVVVPDDMASFVANLSASRLAQIVSLEQTYDVDLTVPRFSTETRVDLKATLQAMGMTDLFDDFAVDLSGINGNVPEPLVISKVIHQANIDVVEQGTTAAAATVVIGRATTGGEGPTPPPHVVFHVDHPFLYLIREKTSGAVLFMGRISDPTLKS